MYIIKVESHTVSSKLFDFGNSMRIFMISHCRGQNMKVTKNKLEYVPRSGKSLT